MYTDSQQILDSIFLSYNKILMRLHNLGLTTKNGKEISLMDLRKAIDVMVEKHPTCRWRSEKIRSRKYFVLIEGYYWLTQVYFHTKKLIILHLLPISDIMRQNKFWRMLWLKDQD